MDVLVIMARQPVMGAVKTRLAREVGQTRALAFYRQCLAATLRRLGRDGRWQTVLAVAPAAATTAASWSRLMPAGIDRMAQCRGDLGARMRHLLGTFGSGRVVVIGSDIPDVRPGHIAAALRQLGRHDVVLGPAEDGGFWLVGSTGVPRRPRLFDGVRWSHAGTLAETIASAGPVRIGLAARRTDVDTAADLARQSRLSGRLIPPA